MFQENISSDSVSPRPVRHEARLNKDPLRGCLEFLPEVLMRVASFPSEWVHSLACVESERALFRVIELEAELGSQKEVLSGILHRMIPGLTGREKSAALELKRFLLREIKPLPVKHFDLLRPLLSDSEGLWNSYQENVARYSVSKGLLEGRISSETALVRRRLRGILADPLVQNSVLTSSLKLFEALRHYLSSDFTESDREKKGQRGFEKSIIQQLSRGTFKTTPRGLLTGVATAQWQSGASSSPVAYTLDPGNKIRCTRTILNLLISRIIAQKVSQSPELISHVVPRTNGSIHVRNENLYFLYPPQGFDDSLKCLPLNPVLSDFISLARTRTLTAAALVAEVLRRHPGSYTSDELWAYYRKLCDRGILLGFLEIPYEEVNGVAYLTRWLEDLGRTSGTQVAVNRFLLPLQDLSATLEQLSSPDLTPESRAEGMRNLSDSVAHFAPDLNPAVLNRLLVTDSVMNTAPLELPASVREDLEAAFRVHVNLSRIYRKDRPHGAIGYAYLKSLNIPESDWQEDCLPFARILQIVEGSDSTETKLERSQIEKAEGETRHQLPADALKRKFLTWLDRHRGADGRLPPSLDLIKNGFNDEIDDLSFEKSKFKAGDGTAEFFVASRDYDSIVQGNYRLIIERFQGNYLISTSRFKDVLRQPRLDRQLSAHVKWIQEEVVSDGALPVELMGFFFNPTDTAASYRGYFENAIELSGAMSGRTGSRIIPMDELVLRRTSGDELQLVWKKDSGNVLLEPYYFSLLFPHLYPPAGRLLALMGWAVGDGTSFGFAPTLHFPNVPHRPRLTVGRAVLARETWRIPAQELAPLPANPPHKAFEHWNRWRIEKGMPRYIFVRYGEDKPFYVDFLNPLTLNLLNDFSKNPGTGILEIEEMLPNPEELWLPVGGKDRHAVHFITGLRWKNPS